MTIHKKPAPVKAAAKINAHTVAVHLGDGRVVEPGEAIPADVTGTVLADLLATGFFK